VLGVIVVGADRLDAQAIDAPLVREPPHLGQLVLVVAHRDELQLDARLAQLQALLLAATAMRRVSDLAESPSCGRSRRSLATRRRR